MIPHQNHEAWQWYGLFREAAVVPKTGTREPVCLGRKSPLDETWHPQTLHPCSVRLPAGLTYGSCTGIFLYLNDSAEAVVRLLNK